jgi:hypothetical protein
MWLQSVPFAGREDTRNCKSFLPDQWQDTPHMADRDGLEGTCQPAMMLHTKVRQKTNCSKLGSTDLLSVTTGESRDIPTLKRTPGIALPASRTLALYRLLHLYPSWTTIAKVRRLSTTDGEVVNMLRFRGCSDSRMRAPLSRQWRCY